MLHARPRQSAFWRFTPIIALLTAGVLLAGGLTMGWYLDRSYREQKIAEVSAQAGILASTVTAALAFADHQAGQEYVNALAANPEVQAAAVYDPSGKVFVSFQRAPEATVPAQIVLHPPQFEDDELVVDAAVVQGGATLGTVYIRTVTEPLIRRIERYAAVGSLVIMASLLMVVLGIAQRALSRANAQLQRQGAELVAANTSLLAQIAQREQAEAALRQAQKMEAIGQLTGGIAHDFNNLLQVILGSLDRLGRRITDPAQAGDPRNLRLIDAAMQGAERAATLTRRLLAFSRRQTLAPTTVDLNKLVTGMTELLLRTLGPSIRIETLLEAGVWPASVDENQLENALLNLAVNARDAMPEGGRLVISTANTALPDDKAPMQDEVETGDYVRVSVTDSGTGMTPDVLAKAFDPFFTTKDIGQGTGLGLSQVYGFVKQSGGHVRIVSAPGEGTSVQLYLPRLQVVIQPSNDDRPPMSAQLPRGYRAEIILVVEDEDEVRMATVETVRELGYDVVEAPDGPTALRRLDQMADIRLLFTDVGLPGGMNGVQLAEAARQKRPDLLVLFTTGYARDAFARNTQFSTGVEVLAKPFSDYDLAYKLRDVLDGTTRPGGLAASPG
jgi:signal transduction histidine kinase/CheY-like chemotaxis protein